MSVADYFTVSLLWFVVLDIVEYLS